MSSTATVTFTMNTISAITVAIGFIGHIVTIIVFLRKTFRSNSISTYCISLAIVECLSAFRFAQNIAIIAFNISSLNDLSEETCKWFTYFLTILASIQSCIQVAFSIDKLLSMRTRSIAIIKKKWFQLSVVAGIVLVKATIYINFPILLKRREAAPGRFVCDLSYMSSFTIIMYEVLLDTFILPFISMIITSALIIRQLYKSRSSIERVGNVNKDRRSRDAKYAITSVTLNILFIILKLPYLVFYTLNAYLFYYNVYFYNISAYLHYLYLSLSFFVHLATNSVFRRELLVLLRLTKENGPNTNSRTNRITPMLTF